MIPALGHDLTDHEAKEPTCAEIGWNAYQTCSRCDYTTYVEIPTLGHSYEYTVTTAPTTAAAGTLTGTCTRDGCGDTVAVTLPKLNKTAYTYETVTAATCTATGTCRYSKVYGNTRFQFNMSLAALGHDRVTDPAVAPTCLNTGLTAGYHCTRCDSDTLAQEVIPALGHSMTVYTDNGEAHTVSCANGCGENYTEAHSFADGICVCGAVRMIESAALVLDNDVDLTYTVTVPEAATDVYMVFTMNGVETTVPDDGSHTFLFEGVNPQCMGDNVSATLYATVGGVEYTDAQPNYSVLQYCRNKLADDTISAELRTLLSDMLVYGTAAEDIFWKSVGLTLTNNVTMNFTFYAESVEGLTVTVAIGGRTETYSDFTAVEGKANTYRINFTDITAAEFDEDVTATFCRNNAQIGDSLTYRVNTYICAKQNDGNTALAALVKALYNYGVSAKAYAEE